MTLRKLAALAAAAAAALALGWIAPAAAQDAGPFAPRQVTVAVGYAPGGGYDIAARLFARHIGKHLPGHPSVVVQNRPGAGSFRLANELYAGLPADGSTLGMVGDVLHIKQVLGESGIRFVATEFAWIGRISNSDPVFVVRRDSPAKTIDEARRREVVVGVPGAGSATAQTLAVVNALLGTRFKLVSGYPGSSEVRLAFERGEVHGTGSMLWSVSRDWIRQNQAIILYQVSFEKYPDLPDVPRLIDLARNDDERRLLAFFSSYTDVGRSILAPPKVPADRVAILRAAFMAMSRDPDFVQDAAQSKTELAILPGEALQKLIADVSGLSGALLEKAKEIGKTEGETPAQ